MASGIFVGSVYATMELQTGGFVGDIARANGALSTFSKTAQASGNIANQFALDVQKGFDGVATKIAGIAKAGATLGLVGAAGIAGFVKTASGLETTALQMDALIGNTEQAQKVYGQLYNYVLGKPIAFPDASKAAATLLGYGRTAEQVIPDMKTLSTLSIVNGADLQALSLVFGQVTSRGALFGQDALQLINNRIPLTNILARKLGTSMEDAASKINGGQISAEQFTEAMREYAESLDIDKFANSFQNRMISLSGSIRSFGLTILGLKIDPIKGLMVESGGLFDRISNGVAQLGPMLKSLAPPIKSVLGFMADNLGTIVALLGSLGAAFVAAKVGSFVAGIAALAPQFHIFITSIKAGATAVQALNVAMLANPAGLIVAGVVAVAAALAFLQIKFNIFGKAFEALKPTIATVQNAFKQLWDFLKPVRDFVAGQLKSAFDSIVSIGKQLADSFKPVIETLKQILANKVVQNVLKGIGIALLAIVAAPVVAFFAAVIAVITVVSKVLGFVAQHFETIKKVVLTVMAIALAPLIIVIGAIVLAVKGIIAIVQNWSKITEAVGNVFKKIGNTIKKAFEPVVKVFQTVASVIGTVFSTIASVVAGVFNTIVGIYNATLKPVLQGIIYVVTALATIWWTVWSGIAQVVFTVVSTIVQIIGVILYGIATFIYNNILTPIFNFFVTVWNGIVSVVTTVVNKIVSVVVSVFTTVKNFVTSVWNAIYSTVSSVLSSIWATVSSVFSTVYNFIAGIVSSIFNTVRSVFNSIWSTISSIASSIWNSVSSTFNNIKNTVVNAITGALTGIKNMASDFISAGKNIIDGIVKGIINAKDMVVNKIKDICSGALDAVKSFFGIKSPSRVMAKMGGYIMEGFGNGIEDETSAVARQMFNAAQSVQDSFSPQLTGVVDYSNIARNGALPLAQNGGSRTLQVYGDINIASEVDADAFLTQAGMTREGQLTERGMAT